MEMSGKVIELKDQQVYIVDKTVSTGLFHSLSLPTSYPVTVGTEERNTIKGRKNNISTRSHWCLLLISLRSPNRALGDLLGFGILSKPWILAKRDEPMTCRIPTGQERGLDALGNITSK